MGVVGGAERNCRGLALLMRGLGTRRDKGPKGRSSRVVKRAGAGCR